MMILYLAVTADKYELPLYVAETRQEMAERFGVTRDQISTAISNYNRRWRDRKDCQRKIEYPNRALFMRIEVDD